MARTSAKAKKQVGKTNKTENLEGGSKAEENTSNKRKDADDSTDKENDDANYEVEKIVHTRVFKGKRQYLVRWKGYHEDSDTWENESVVQSCQEALDTFKSENSDLLEKSKLDSDNEDDDEPLESIKKDIKEKKNAQKSKEKTSKKQNAKRGKKDTKESDGEENDKIEEDEEQEIKEEEKGGKRKSTKAGKKDKGKIDNEIDEPSKKKAKSNKESDDESVTDGKDYEVDRIIEVHTRRDGTREFLIRWKGYKPSEDTWEPEAHLDCQDLIDKFMEKVDQAKNIPARELRESRPVKRFMPSGVKKRSNLRNPDVRPCYQE